MIVAERLRQENIVEYLLYMWQVEDIIRAYRCSLSAMRRDYLPHFAVADEQGEELADWYGNLIRMMNEEGKRAAGHLTINEIIVQQLGELHAALLASPRFPFYSAEYYKVLPFIVELRHKGSSDSTEIETCLNALYGVLLLRMQKKEVSAATQHAVSEIVTFLGMLADYYKKDKTEGIDFDN